MIKHYIGKQGDFDYDDQMYKYNNTFDCIQFNDNYVGPISLPEGMTSCYVLFRNCNVREGCYLDNFDTKNVNNMQAMFLKASLPEGFTLGASFDTSSVENMMGMFSECKLPADFSLGQHFDTSKVTDMRSMFYDCSFPKDFSLGLQFNTENVEKMNGMFQYSQLNSSFDFGQNFDTSHCKDMTDMFLYCRANCKTMDLGSKFNFDRADAIDMLSFDVEPEKLIVGETFDLKRANDLGFFDHPTNMVVECRKGREFQPVQEQEQENTAEKTQEVKPVSRKRKGR